ncbi:protein MAIN-LIKE 2-like [Arachis hypogaea]|uniref:protein MAIN-LIKE 2-like n=1 Tax=Arachis hypogaea TaxID=3818 RepID=UPI003B20D37B
MEEQLLGYEGEIYRLDHAEHIAGRLDQAPHILRTRRNLMTQSLEQIRPYLRRVGFEYTAYMVEFEHDWPLASALIERWRPESHTFHLPELEQDTTEECLVRYTRGYIMHLIGGFLFPDASDSREHIRWLPLLEELDTCGQLSWGSAVLAWMYR